MSLSGRFGGVGYRTMMHHINSMRTRRILDMMAGSVFKLMAVTISVAKATIG